MPSPVLPLLVTDLTRAGRGARASGRPLHHQLYTALRDGILTGRLAPGSRLPATRALAADLGLGRNTVLAAYDQLHAEGYLDGRVGSGSFVTTELPAPSLRRRTGPRPSSGSAIVPAPAAPRTGPRLGLRGRRFVHEPVTLARGGPPRAFRAGVPALDLFPLDAWSRVVARAWKDAPRALLGYADALGYAPLREAVAAHLRASRAVRCDASQVILTNGAQHALHLVAHALLEPGDAVWFEDPGYRGARIALRSAGIDVAPIPIDEEGLRVEEGVRRAPAARAAYVTPSHQYPLGVTMSLSRRLELLAWARQRQAWIIEDDYDSEFRYTGRPLASLQGLDTADRVIYVGTFSKVLCPALRVGYLVAPPAIVETLTIARGVTDRHGATIEQAALARFIDAGGLVRHIRQMRARYAERQEVLVTAAARDLEGLLDVPPQPAGLHLIGWLPDDADDRAAAARALTHGVETSPLAAYHASGRSTRPGLSLGYAAVNAAAIRTGVRALAAALREEASARRRNSGDMARRPGRPPRRR